MQITMIRNMFGADRTLYAAGTSYTVADALALEWIGNGAAVDVGSGREDQQGTQAPVSGGGSSAPIVLTASRALTSTDDGASLIYSGATNITVTVPAGLGANFRCSIRQLGAGIVAVIPDSTIGIQNAKGTYSLGMAAGTTGAGSMLSLHLVDSTSLSVTNGRGPRTAYIGHVSNGDYCHFANTGSSIGYINQRLRNRVYDDVSVIVMGFSTVYGTQETASAGTASIELSVEDSAGTPQRVTFSGSNVGTIPAAGMLFSDPIVLQKPISAGGQLVHRAFVTYNNTGSNGNHRDCAAYGMANTAESSVTGVAGSPPANTVMSGTPSGTSSICLRPTLILGLTNKNTWVTVGDSLEAADYSFPRATTGLRRGGVISRWLQKVAASFRSAYNGDSYFSVGTGSRFALRNLWGDLFSTHVMDEMGVNDNLITLAQFIAYMQTMSNRFPGKPYYHTTFIPRTTSTDLWVTQGNQSVHSNAANQSQYNQAIRALTPPLAGFVELAYPVESYPDSRIFAISPVALTVDVTSINSSLKQVVATAGTFQPGDLYKQFSYVNAGVLYTGQITSVVSSTTIQLYCNSTSGLGTGLAGYLKLPTVDGLHPTVDCELLIEASDPARALAYVN